ncbi:MAG: ATP-binding protein [Chloroflexi bacterium]|nr:ATP-binding protein [Chloroflexota bacterium]
MPEKGHPGIEPGSMPKPRDWGNDDYRPSAQELQIHDRILAMVSSASARMLRNATSEEHILDVLASIGKAINVNCCVLFEIDLNLSKPTAHHKFIWHRPGSERLNLVSLLEPYIVRIGQTQDGFFLESAIQNAAATEKSVFSLAILPTNPLDTSQGYLGIIDTQKEQTWHPALRDALRISTNLIGAILERNRFEEKFRENEIRNRIIIDALPDLVIRIDSSGKILDYTSRKDHPLFINRDVISGKMLSEIWPKNIVNKIIQGRKKNRFLKHQILEEFKLPFSNKVYESRLDPIGQHEALIVIRDVTDQAELKQMKSDFINQASHELRTPVTSSILMAELIQEGGLPEEIEEYWQILNSELNRQKILIDRLLIAGRLESGMMHLEIAPTVLETILQESISAIKPIARKKNISIELSNPETTPLILGDKSGLEQVFINLINNATKFSPEGSIVKIKVTHDGPEVQVAVIDQGMGIPAHETIHLFERFFRAREVTIAEIPGSGVGLYIVKSILEGLGGSIKLTSSTSAGTTFTATLRSAK